MADRIELEFLRGDKGSEPFALPASRQSYLLRRTDGSYRSATLDWDAELLNDMGLLYRGERDRAAAQRIGDRLAALLRDLDWGAARAQLSERLRGTGRIELVIRSFAAEIYALPWELTTLEGTGESLGELDRLLVRYELPATKPAADGQTDPALGRVLYAWSAAGGAVPQEAHGKAIADAAAAGCHPYDPAEDTVPNASIGRIVEAMRQKPPAVLHLLCHGGTVGGVFGLVLDGPGGGEVVDPGTLRQALAPFVSTLRLVVLSACHGGHSGPPGNHLGSSAQALHQLGIPAVVSSRFPLSVPGSIDLANTLWRRLLVDLDSVEDAFLAARTKLEDRTTTLDWASIQLWCHVTRAPDLRPIVVRPYRGLLPFRKEDDRFFFGREKESAELIARVRADARGEHGITILAGASGSGKSSMVQAGLIPALTATDGELWRVVFMRPGTGAPMTTLRRALGDEAAEDVVALATRQVPAPADRLLLLVDQFEEVFTVGKAKEQAQPFMDALWRIASAPRCAVLLSMRVDYFSRCAELALQGDKTLIELVYDSRHRVFIGPMDVTALTAAIRNPVERVGLVLEEGLSDALLREVRDQPAALPLLEYALEMLWAKRDGHVLRHSTFQELGGVEGALTRTADAFVAEISPEVLRQVRRLFIEMVEIRGESSFGSRRRVVLDEIRPTDPAEIPAFEEAIEGLIRLHLVVVGEEQTHPPHRWMDLAHESLIRRWTLLQGWIDADRERALAIRKLRDWTQELAANAAAVLDESRLGYALSVRADYPGALGPDVLALIDRSVRARQRLRHKRERRILGLTAAAILVAFAMGILGLRAERARSGAESARNLAAEQAKRAERLALRARNAMRLSVARTVRDNSPTRALVLLRDIEADATTDQDDAAEATRWPEEAIILMQRPLSRAIYHGHTQSVTDAEYSADGKLVLTASHDGTARIWTQENNVPSIVLRHDEPVRRAMFIDDNHVGTGGEHGGVWLWTLGEGEPQKERIARHGDEVTDIDSNGTWILTAGLDGQVWRWEGPSKPPLLFSHPRGVRSVDTAPDGHLIAAACDDGLVYLWSPDAPDRPPITLKGHKGAALDVDFSPDSRLLVSAGDDGQTLVWDTKERRMIRALNGGGEAMVGAEWSPDGRQILTWSTDGNVRIHEPDRSEPVVILDDLHGVISEAAWSNDGKRIVAGSASGQAAVWLADNSRAPVFLPGHTDRIASTAFSPDGERVVTASSDGDARSWSIQQNPNFVPLRPSPTPILALDVSPEGRIAVATAGGALLLFREDGTGPEQTIALTQDAAVTVVTWDAEGKRLAVSSDSGKVFIVDESARQKVTVLDGGRQPMANVSWHPVDRTQLVSTGEEGSLFFWDLDQPQSPKVISISRSKLWAAEYLPSGEEVIVATDDGNLYRVPTGLSVAERLGPTRPSTIYVIAIRPDGAEVAFSTQDGGVWVRSLVDPNAEDRRIGSHSGPAFDLRYSADGARVLSASYDGTVGLWSATANPDPTVQMHMLRGHSTAVNSVAFMPDGAHFVSGAADGTAFLWSTSLFEQSTESVLNELRAQSTACLSVDEYANYLHIGPEEAELAWQECERAQGRPSTAESTGIE